MKSFSEMALIPRKKTEPGSYEKRSFVFYLIFMFCACEYHKGFLLMNSILYGLSSIPACSRNSPPRIVLPTCIKGEKGVLFLHILTG